ncbi:5-methyltetrahydropteroyltriglutamate--homocysteine S-methyltransferase [Paenibacillus sp. JX-17]|uniref:5-methyltetrahydropteroyltriglutamate--homocysteine methyltransferase n=1 Tax=Paenibacillus lacisoli TaxID=3064525 RepID=A0ABT9CFM1_9BACL|nr:5-methyltetrahydropteroyltriglutamate--homocysteine S-methyltransferase [Paenibacillus sp. JX-17]MDO7908055.1 5-methyltetrahydropteroyltriglutamate--homocysteine S-methyltransferase [Paenibacillus sp. JX-17]
MKSANLGYPRIGGRREWKKALEQYWAGQLAEADLVQQLKEIRLGHLRRQLELGVEIIPVNDFTYYDHVLDTAAMFGLVPERFDYSGGPVELDVYYAMARGSQKAAACEMTKWFNTNYHYIVPEFAGRVPELTENKPLQAYREAKRELGIEGRPVILGLYTLVKLSKGYAEDECSSWVDKLLPLYVQVLQELKAEGVVWIQMDEPILNTTLYQEDLQNVKRIYEYIAQQVPGLKLMLQTYFDSVDDYEQIIHLPVAGIGLDFVHDRGENLKALIQHGFPEKKVLGAGVIDGRGIWRADLNQTYAVLNQLSQIIASERLLVQPSSSLLHVPVTAESEQALEPVLKNALAFADEKLREIVLLTQAGNGLLENPDHALASASAGRYALQQSSSRNAARVQAAAAELTEQQAQRSKPVRERSVIQKERFQLPLLPTTTIGSFPQTAEIRAARQKWRRKEWSEDQYSAFIDEQIKLWIGLQEQLGLDVLVHGEFERTDMVEFFGEKLAGFAFTSFGWVQSYGSRCVKPPIIYGDVDFVVPMTVRETVFAQSLTSKPVKGMLTGPITILNWSFVRDDVTRETVANQIALALRQEVAELEAAGVGMIQVDEPALREGLPLKREHWEAYLEWAVRAFRYATAGVRDETQIHTHMCYCDFEDIMESISGLDADVISIESSRSHGELVESFEQFTYDKGIGLGVFDIHSPRVPSVEEIGQMIDRALRVLDPAQFWINPDCGLKTRRAEETLASLRNMTQAAELARPKYQAELAR